MMTGRGATAMPSSYSKDLVGTLEHSLARLTTAMGRFHIRQLG